MSCLAFRNVPLDVSSIARLWLHFLTSDNEISLVRLSCQVDASAGHDWIPSIYRCLHFWSIVKHSSVCLKRIFVLLRMFCLKSQKSGQLEALSVNTGLLFTQTVFLYHYFVFIVSASDPVSGWECFLIRHWQGNSNWGFPLDFLHHFISPHGFERVGPISKLGPLQWCRVKPDSTDIHLWYFEIHTFSKSVFLTVPW